MSQRKVSFAPGEFYHLYNRGNSKQKIFFTHSDYVRFMQQLFVANSSKPFNLREIDINELYMHDRGNLLVNIAAYCLMPNHFHILLTPVDDNGVQRFMQKLSTGYSMYFNKKYKRTGGLFEGRFKSEHVDQDEYLKYLYSYIHLNPVKLIDPEWRTRGTFDISKTLTYLDSYYYSSYADYLRSRTESVILNRDSFPEYFNNPQSVTKEMFDWLAFKTDQNNFEQ